MKSFIAPVSFRSRDKRVSPLIRKDKVTHDELFEAQFGEWPVRGHDKQVVRNETISFKGFHRDRRINPLSYIFNTGYVRKKEPTSIYLNNVLLSPLGHILGVAAGRMAWARLHDLLEVFITAETPRAAPVVFLLTLMSSYRYAFASSMTKMIAPSIADIVFEEQVHTLQELDKNKAVTQDVYLAAAQDRLNHHPYKTGIEIMQAVDAILTLMPRQYFAADHELQARLGSIMARGYPAWGRIPENKNEFYAAMLDSGIIAPGALKKAFDQDAGYQSLRDVFKKQDRLSAGYLRPANAEMNIGLNSFRSQDILKLYWLDCLPFLYADLMVKMGDPGGYEKMGYTAQQDVLGLPMLPSADAQPGGPTP